MTVPPDYVRASEDFRTFLIDARDTLGHTTTNQAYHTVLGVLLAFRRRVSARDGLVFADALPPLLRAAFTAGWDPDAPRQAFGTREAMTEDVRRFQRDHNFAPEDAIAGVAAALRRHADRRRFELMLGKLPPEAAAYWAV